MQKITDEDIKIQKITDIDLKNQKVTDVAGVFKDEFGVFEIIRVDTSTFVKDYEFYGNYADLVVRKGTDKIYKSRYAGAFVQLIEISNIEAMKKIEKGMAEFKEQLIRELGEGILLKPDH